MARMASASSGRANRTATPGRLTIICRTAPLAQSAEHSHGKAGVIGSIPIGGSQQAIKQQVWRRSSVGKSTRLIIEGSAVRVRPPLPHPHEPHQKDRTMAKQKFERNKPHLNVGT